MQSMYAEGPDPDRREAQRGRQGHEKLSRSGGRQEAESTLKDGDL